MSHECPACGEFCFCHGDINDSLINSEQAENNCEHWRKCDKDYSEIDEDEVP